MKMSLAKGSIVITAVVHWQILGGKAHLVNGASILRGCHHQMQRACYLANLTIVSLNAITSKIASKGYKRDELDIPENWQGVRAQWAWYSLKLWVKSTNAISLISKKFGIFSKFDNTLQNWEQRDTFKNRQNPQKLQIVAQARYPWNCKYSLEIASIALKLWV
jgi:hypothetical protein